MNMFGKAVQFVRSSIRYISLGEIQLKRAAHPASI